MYWVTAPGFTPRQHAQAEPSHPALAQPTHSRTRPFPTQLLTAHCSLAPQDDYNPLTARSATIRVPTGDIRDPLKRDVLKPMYERAMMGGSVDSLPLGKHTLDNKDWGQLRIKATPYGHCTDGTGAYVVRPQSSGTVATRRSRIPSDHYGEPVVRAWAELGTVVWANEF